MRSPPRTATGAQPPSRGRFPGVALCACLLGLPVFSTDAWALTDPDGARTGEKPVPQADAPPVRAAQRWIEQLADERYSARKQAYAELKAIGRPALEPLTEALEVADPEVRTRAAQLLVELRGRGFMGIQLQEDWEGDDPFQGLNRAVEDEEGAGAPDANGQPPAEAKGKPPPFVLAVSVLRAKDMEPEIQQLLKGGEMPAEKAGVADGDRVLAVNGRPIRGVADLLREVTLAGPKTKIPMLVERNGKRLTLSVTLTRNPADKNALVDLLAEEGAPAAGETERRDQGSFMRKPPAGNLLEIPAKE